MEIFIFILIYVGLLFVIYKFAESKNRESMGYTFAGLIVSPIIILIILAFLKKLPKTNKKKKKKQLVLIQWESVYMIIDFFNWCVWVLEVIGNVTGMGYELANIVIFVILQPALILLFFILWRIEKRKNKSPFK